MKEPIRKITLKDGTVRYRLVVDVGRDGTASVSRSRAPSTSAKEPAKNCHVSATRPAGVHT
jgi:hypothetical protein